MWTTLSCQCLCNLTSWFLCTVHVTFSKHGQISDFDYSRTSQHTPILLCYMINLFQMVPFMRPELGFSFNPGSNLNITRIQLNVLLLPSSNFSTVPHSSHSFIFFLRQFTASFLNEPLWVAEMTTNYVTMSPHEHVNLFSTLTRCSYIIYNTCTNIIICCAINKKQRPGPISSSIL